MLNMDQNGLIHIQSVVQASDCFSLTLEGPDMVTDHGHSGYRMLAFELFKFYAQEIFMPGKFLFYCFHEHFNELTFRNFLDTINQISDISGIPQDIGGRCGVCRNEQKRATRLKKDQFCESSYRCQFNQGTPSVRNHAGRSVDKVR
jgi:hypothetical protein